MTSPGSGMIRAHFSASSDQPDPIDALRAALFALGKSMAGAGFGPPHLKSMRWASADPEALNPEHMAVNLAYREAFVGFRPPIERVHAALPGVTVEAECRRPSEPPPEAIVALERDYSARRGVDMEAVLGRWRQQGAEARRLLEAAGRARLDLAFAEGPFSRLDLFVPVGKGPHPCWIFLHGGYWMATDKAQYAQFATGLLNAGFAVALPNYALAPDVPVRRQVEDAGAALRFLAREAPALGLDAAGFHLSGHSAGAHLAALLAAEPNLPALRSLYLLSGLYDVAALGPTALGRLIGFADRSVVEALSPLRRPRPADLRIAHALGEREAPGFFAEARKLEEGWQVPPAKVLAEDNHFTLLEGLKGGALLEHVLACLQSASIQGM